MFTFVSYRQYVNAYCFVRIAFTYRIGFFRIDPALERTKAKSKVYQNPGKQNDAHMNKKRTQVKTDVLKKHR